MSATTVEMMPFASLTPKQQEMVDTICRLHWYANRAPTYRELMEAFGYASLNAVETHLKPLRRLGWLAPKEAGGKRARAITVLADPPDWVRLPGGGMVPLQDLGDLIEKLRGVWLRGKE